MGRRRKRRLKWRLLLRYEQGFPVYVYEPLSYREVDLKMRRGWKCVM